MNNEIEQLAEQHGMTVEFVAWFFGEKKAACGSFWLMMMAAMWEGWKGRDGESTAALATIEKCREVSGCPAGVDLQDYLRQLVSELSVVEGIHNDAVFITDELYDASPKEVQNIIRSLACMKMPAYARLVAGIKADGVDSGIETIITMLNHQAPGVIDAINVLSVHSFELREGADKC